jgi:NAD(P)-dependent dehydrogenase (short-subunit alcohol dehydrogenase family)
MFDLSDKITAVTGAGSGIGESIARTFAAAGAVVYVLERNEGEGRRVAESLANGRGRFVQTDVSSEESSTAAARRLLDENGRCDVLVNNAGIGHVGTALTTGGADLQRLWSVNVMGIHFVTKPILADMVSKRRGSIVNMASIAGVVGLRDRYAYTTTKFAVVGLTKAMALDHAEAQVRVNCICPGRVETPFVKQRLAEYPDPKKAYAEMAASQALGRMGRPDEIAAAALYLASDEAAFVTGSCLIIDGGLSAGK